MSALAFKAIVDPSLACFLAYVMLRFTAGVTPADCSHQTKAKEIFACVPMGL